MHFNFKLILLCNKDNLLLTKAACSKKLHNQKAISTRDNNVFFLRNTCHITDVKLSSMLMYRALKNIVLQGMFYQVMAFSISFFLRE